MRDMVTSTMKQIALRVVAPSRLGQKRTSMKIVLQIARTLPRTGRMTYIAHSSVCQLRSVAAGTRTSPFLIPSRARKPAADPRLLSARRPCWMDQTRARTVRTVSLCTMANATSRTGTASWVWGYSLWFSLRLALCGLLISAAERQPIQRQ